MQKEQDEICTLTKNQTVSANWRGDIRRICISIVIMDLMFR